MDFDYEYYQKLPKPSQMAMKHLKVSFRMIIQNDYSNQMTQSKLRPIWSLFPF